MGMATVENATEMEYSRGNELVDCISPPPWDDSFFTRWHVSGFRTESVFECVEGLCMPSICHTSKKWWRRDEGAAGHFSKRSICFFFIPFVSLLHIRKNPAWAECRSLQTGSSVLPATRAFPYIYNVPLARCACTPLVCRRCEREVYA